MKKIEDAVQELGGVWPGYDVDAVYLYKIDNRYIAGLPGGTALHICNLTEFVECTRRLRNEPSFDDHPDAKCFVQNADGRWYKNSTSMDVKPGIEGWLHRHWLSSDNDSAHGWYELQKGEVIGDWRDTLRLRPEEKKMEEKNNWYERGEMPPVGAVCEVMYDRVWEQTKIIGWDDEFIVVTTEWDEILDYDGLCAEPSDFRPLQTERERWVEMARKATFEADEKQNYYEAIYDAGLAKMPEYK